MTRYLRVADVKVNRNGLLRTNIRIDLGLGHHMVIQELIALPLLVIKSNLLDPRRERCHRLTTDRHTKEAK